MSKKVLITGVAGLLGSRLADWIIENKKGYKVVGIDDLSGGYIENVNPKVDFWKGNLVTDSNVITRLFNTHQFDYVFHFAAYAAEGLSPFIRTFNYDNNLRATATIVNECIKQDVKRLVFTSTMAVYGHGEGGIFHEDMRRNPIDPYGIAKMACERDIEVANEQHGLDYCIIRPHNVYGPDMGNEHVIPEFINRFKKLKGKFFKIQGVGSETRSFIYIDDFVQAFECILKRGKHLNIYNIGTNEKVTINQLAKKLSKIFEKKILIKKTKLTKGSTKKRLPDIKKIK